MSRLQSQEAQQAAREKHLSEVLSAVRSTASELRKKLEAAEKDAAALRRCARVIQVANWVHTCVNRHVRLFSGQVQNSWISGYGFSTWVHVGTWEQRHLQNFLAASSSIVGRVGHTWFSGAYSDFQLYTRQARPAVVRACRGRGGLRTPPALPWQMG